MWEVLLDYCHACGLGKIFLPRPSCSRPFRLEAAGQKDEIPHITRASQAVAAVSGVWERDDAILFLAYTVNHGTYTHELQLKPPNSKKELFWSANLTAGTLSVQVDPQTQQTH